MKYLIYLLLLISSSCIGQVRDYNLRIGSDKDPDSTYCLVTAVTGSNFAGRGQFKSLPQLATLLQPFLSGGADNQFLLNSQTSTTHTINLSDAGGDPNNGELILIEGSGIRLATTGTATASELTISAVDTSVTNEIQGIDNVLSQAEALTANRSINLSGTPYDFRISAGNADFLRIAPTSSGTYEFGDVDNTYSGPRFYLGGSSTSYLYNGLADVVFGINKTNPAEALDVVGNGLFSGTLTASNLSGTNTGDQDLSGYLTSEVDGSTSNELQTITNSSDATSHTVTLSNSGGTVQLIEGSGVTLTTGGTGSAGTVTIASTATGVSDGDKGDITVSSSGTVWDIDAGVVGDTELGSGLDATQLADGTVTSTEFQYINTLSSNAQTQLDAMALRAGRSGGQTLIGGTGTTDDLILQSTSGVGATGALIQMKVGNNGGTTALTILNDGKVGIGTTGPVTQLNVSGTAASGTENVGRFDTGAQYGGFFLNNSSNRQARMLFGQSGTEKWQFGIDFAAANNADFYIYDNTGARNPLYITTGGDVRLGGTSGYSGTQAMTILQGGKVGVGTTAPDGKVEVNLGTFDAFRLSYNDANGSAANYMDATISSVGSPTFNATGTSPTFTFSDPVLFDGYARLKAYTVATLPTGVTGAMAYVTDATAPTYLGALTGGGAVVCPVFYNGTAWVSH